MADFCFQCSIDHYFGPYSDFNHLGEGHPPGTVFAVICEGCSVPGALSTIVNGRGWCVDPSCRVHGRKAPPERRKVYEDASRWVERRSGRLGPVLRLWDYLWGTPWEPGLRHDWRYRYHCWRQGEDGFQLIGSGPLLFIEEPLDLGQFPLAPPEDLVIGDPDG